MKRPIPKIQANSLYPLADELRHSGFVGWAKRLRRYTTELYRRAPTRRAPTNKRKMTPALRVAIRAYARTHPYTDYCDIAKRFNVNHGRVSEACAGYRR